MSEHPFAGGGHVQLDTAGTVAGVLKDCKARNFLKVFVYQDSPMSPDDRNRFL